MPVFQKANANMRKVDDFFSIKKTLKDVRVA